MILNKQERVQLAGIYGDPKFQVVLKFLDNCRSNLEKASTIGDNEFETLAKGFSRQYKVELINEIKELLQQEAAAVGVDDE